MIRESLVRHAPGKVRTVKHVQFDRHDGYRLGGEDGGVLLEHWDLVELPGRGVTGDHRVVGGLCDGDDLQVGDLGWVRNQDLCYRIENTIVRDDTCCSPRSVVTPSS